MGVEPLLREACLSNWAFLQDYKIGPDLHDDHGHAKPTFVQSRTKALRHKYNPCALVTCCPKFLFPGFALRVPGKRIRKCTYRSRRRHLRVTQHCFGVDVLPVNVLHIAVINRNGNSLERCTRK